MTNSNVSRIALNGPQAGVTMYYRTTTPWAVGETVTYQTLTKDGEVLTDTQWRILSCEVVPDDPCCFLADEPARKTRSLYSDLTYSRSGLTSLRDLIKRGEYAEAAEWANEISACLGTMVADLEHLQHVKDAEEADE